MKKSTKDRKTRPSQKPDRWPIITQCIDYLKLLNANNRLIAILFFIQMIWTLPQPLIRQAAGLDPSWVNAIYMMVLDHMQQGRDVIFSYGPLGFLAYPMLIDHDLWRIAILFQITVHALMYLAVFVLLRKLTAKWYHYLLMLPVLLFAALPMDELLPILTSIMLFISLIGDDKGKVDGSHGRSYVNYLWLTLSGALIAVSSLLKFNSLFVGVSLMVIAALAFVLWKKNYKLGLYLVFSSVFFFMVFWFATGQSFANVPDYLRYGIELTQGYSSAMSLEGTFSEIGQFELFAVSAFCILWLLAYSLAERKRNILIFILMNSVLLFSSYKHGFVRHDLHILDFLQMYILVLGILLVIASIDLQKKKNNSCLLCCAITLITIFILVSTIITIAPSTLNDNILTRSGSYALMGQLLTDQSAFNSIIASDKEQVKSSYGVSDQMLGRIGNQSIDVIPWDISLCWAYGLNWSPRFVFQSYTDYTADLDNVTSRHFIDSDPPRFVIYSYKSIDSRYPPFDEPATFRAILDHYDYAQNEGEFILLNHSDSLGNYTHGENLGTVTGKICQEIPVPDHPGLVFGNVYVETSAYGKIMDLLYKPANLYVRFKFSDGKLSGAYRFIPNDGSNGLLLSHFIGNQNDLANLFQGDTANNIEGVYIFTDDPGQYNSNIKVSFTGYS